MAWYQAKARIEAILWTGWTPPDPWPEEWKVFFGRNPFSKIKAEYVGEVYKIYLFVNNVSWKELPDGWYVTRTPTTNGDGFRYNMVEPELFNQKWELED